MKIIFDNLSKDFGSHTVLNTISGVINEGEIIGLIGANGVGKTTLLKILTGLENHDSGEIHYSPKELRVKYMDQFPVFRENSTVYEEVLTEILGIEEINDLNPEVEAGIGAEARVASEAKAKKALNSMGLNQEMWYRQAASLSGGEKTKLSLCKAMVGEFDVLFLDEPSNHLDIQSCEYLENYIVNLGKSNKKSVVAISHDRFFLDAISNRIWELTSRGLTGYEGNYSAYRQQKEVETRNAEKEYNKQQAEIQQLKHVINERKNWYASAHKAAGQNDFARAKAKKHVGILRAKEKHLERLEKNKVEKPQSDFAPTFDVINRDVSVDKLPTTLVTGQNIVKQYEKKVIFDNAGFTVNRGDKIALIGKNGSGKSTLLKIICGLDQEFGGTVSVTPKVEIGYFAQGLELLESDSSKKNFSILDYVIAQGTSAGEARLLLANLLFRGDEVFKNIGSLSMGEKGRVVFARLILAGANLLVLDEVTNYMDILSREKIEEVLEEYQGALLFVSHDRFFVNRLADKVIAIEEKKLRTYEGNYQYYLNKAKENRKREEIGEEYKELSDRILQLECRLSFLSGELSSVQDEEEKHMLDQEFVATARELNFCKKILEGK